MAGIGQVAMNEREREKVSEGRFASVRAYFCRTRVGELS